MHHSSDFFRSVNIHETQLNLKTNLISFELSPRGFYTLLSVDDLTHGSVFKYLNSVGSNPALRYYQLHREDRIEQIKYRGKWLCHSWWSGRSLATLEIHGSIPVIEVIFIEHYRP